MDNNVIPLSSQGTRSRCKTCGQQHESTEEHVYDYTQEVDEELTCTICLQPFVAPVDVPCGHTFCQACLHNYLKTKRDCPIDRKPTTAKDSKLSNLVLRKWTSA